MPQVQPIVVKSGSSWIAPVIIIAGGGLAYYFIAKPLIDKMKSKSQLSKEQNSTIKAKSGGKLYDLTGKPIQSANLGTIAAELNQALHPGWYKPTEQDRVIRVFNTTPFGYVKQLEDFYLNRYNEPLKQTMLDKMSDENFIKVKYQFR